VLASVLLDLTQTATLQASSEVAASMLGSLDDAEVLLSNQVECANFVVLKSPDVPSALVETAFISNPTEERKLRKAAFQEKIARALHHGVRSYFKTHAPPGSLLAALNHEDTIG
jgi:N-acetylmuramoyl-L-alanine amidase